MNSSALSGISLPKQNDHRFVVSQITLANDLYPGSLLLTAPAIRDLELNLVAFFERFEALTGDLREVNEEILAAFGILYKSVTLSLENHLTLPRATIPP